MSLNNFAYPSVMLCNPIMVLILGLLLFMARVIHLALNNFVCIFELIVFRHFHNNQVKHIDYNQSVVNSVYCWLLDNSCKIIKVSAHCCCHHHHHHRYYLLFSFHSVVIITFVTLAHVCWRNKSFVFFTLHHHWMWHSFHWFSPINFLIVQPLPKEPFGQFAFAMRQLNNYSDFII